MAKKEVVSVDFKRPRQFLGIEGNVDERVYFGVCHDVPMAVANSPAFAIYKEDETALVLGEAREEEEDPSEEAPAKKGK